MSARIFRRRLLALFAIAVVGAVFVFTFFPYLIIDIGYLARPLWDNRPVHFDKVLIHHYAEGMSMKDRCEAHGWTYNPDPTIPQPKVYDAVIFSVELDMLEIRMRELWDVVDKFVILESNGTFTGLPKEQVFAKHKRRFAWAESKIVYKSLPLKALKPGETAWDNEGRTRDAMLDVLVSAGLQPGDLITSVDTDEVIRRHTLELLKSCTGVPDSIHLQLRNYLYSYEFPVINDFIWQTNVHKYRPGATRYSHGKTADVLLTDAGWHCSFCFRTIADFQFKMQAYSHGDRVRNRKMMEATWIQNIICEGKDLFGMFPEAYTFHELFTLMGSIPKSQTAVGLPRWVVENRERFKFLLPGGCQRQGQLAD
ncbi:hypothetical protein BGW39_011245 [Mortierella sp. 14UC]|nr:hypothetical protein BGW39_011245 [Mortierella sp. 14UC]